ncbi:MAG: PepSY-associated TM helix domain-containing protein [Pseudomonadota bacterium]
MDRARHLRNYDLHSWTGIALGFFVFIVAFTGSVALFDEELRTWEDPARRLTLIENPVPIDAHFRAFLTEQQEEGELTSTSLKFPDSIEPYYTGFAFLEDEQGEFHFHQRRWDPSNGNVLPERGEGLSVWLLDFHRDLMWPAALGGRTIGRALVGVVGVILMLAILTGVIAHTKILEELFSLRYWRSVRLKWQDTHKVAGLWGLPFFAMISITGAFLGIVAVLSPIVAVLAFKGDTEALIEAVIGAPPEPAGIEAQMIPIDDLLEIKHEESGAAPDRVIVSHWGDEAATYNLLYYADKELTLYDSVTISAVNGERVSNQTFDTDTPANRVTSAVTPLHYGTFGGEYGSFGAIALKLLYFALGLCLAIITGMGNMMWIERRLHGNDGNRSEVFYRRLSRFNVGVCAGLPLASVAIFYLDKLYGGAEVLRMSWTGWVYFGVWFAAIIFAQSRENEYLSLRALLAVTGIGLIGIPILNGMTTGDFFWVAFASGHSISAWIDISCLAVGVLTFAASRTLPEARPENKKKRAQKTRDEPALAPAE